MNVLSLLGELTEVGRNPTTGGYDRLAWTGADAELRGWFTQTAHARGLEVETDRNGNLWAWWHAELPGTALVVGSHLDSVPSGGAYDGPLGVASAFAAIAQLQDAGVLPGRPVAVVAFADEEGARFGVACAGSRLMAGALDPDRARTLRDGDGITLAEAFAATGRDAVHLGADDARMRRIGEFVELHVEQGHLPSSTGEDGLGSAPLGLATSIWPHGRWRVDIRGQQNHAGTTRLSDREDPMIGLARVILAVREAAGRERALATVGRVQVHPGAVNAIPGAATAWIDARAGEEDTVRRVLAEVTRATGFSATEESWTAETRFDQDLTTALNGALGSLSGGGELPLLPSGAGHDAGVLALAGIPTAMILVRNPSGVSHAPEEYADDDASLLGVEALAEVIRLRSRALA